MRPERIRATPYRTLDRAYCEACGKPVELLSFEQAVDFVKTGMENIYRLAESHELHQLHNSRGVVMICGNSLFRLLNNRQKAFDAADSD